LTRLQAEPILSLAEAKALLNWPSGTEKDALLTSFIAMASQHCEDLLKNPVVYRDFQEIVDGSGSERLYPSWYPYGELYGLSVQEKFESLQVRETYDAPWENLFGSANDWTIITEEEPQYLLRLDGYVFPEGIQNVRHHYTAGYQEIPARITETCQAMVHWLWKRSFAGDNFLGKQSVSEGREGASSTLTLKDMDKEWIVMLKAYLRLEDRLKLEKESSSKEKSANA